MREEVDSSASSLLKSALAVIPRDVTRVRDFLAGMNLPKRGHPERSAGSLATGTQSKDPVDFTIDVPIVRDERRRRSVALQSCACSMQPSSHSSGELCYGDRIQFIRPQKSRPRVPPLE